MAKSELEIDQILTLLAAAPARIAAATAGLTPAQLRTDPEPGEWSVVGVLAHLRSCSDVWGGCIATLLAEDAPTIRAVNPTTWIRQTNYPDLEFQPSFSAYVAQRADLLTILRGLGSADWSRSATVTGAGRLLQRTVRGYAGNLAIHERQHDRQFAKTVRMVRSGARPG